jgi:MazG family protein
VSAGLDGVRRLLDVVQTLRGPGGCPWDREQTLETLKPFAVEEVYEVIDAIESGNVAHHREELGDLLLQVALQSQIRAEEGAFTFDDVAAQLAEKLVRRHPHVFGDVTAETSGQVLKNWQAIKATEKTSGAGEAPASAVGGIPRHLPALQRAQRIQGRAARVGFDWERTADVLAKVEEEVAEIRAETEGEPRDPGRVREEIGDLLFALVNLCRFLDVEAEDALRGATEKFIRRFQQIEARVHAAGRTMQDHTLAELDAHWDDVKRGERGVGTSPIATPDQQSSAS